MGLSPRTARLKINMAGSEYILGTLSLKAQGEEQISYFLHLPEELVTQLNNETNQTTSPIDHITWHKNDIHVVTRNKKKENEIGKIKEKLLPSNGKMKVIFIESFVISSNPRDILSKLTRWETIDEEHLLIIFSEIRDFSLVFLLVPQAMDTKDILLDPKIRLPLFNGYDLVVTVLLDIVIPVKDLKGLMPLGPHRRCHYDKPQKSLELLGITMKAFL